MSHATILLMKQFVTRDVLRLIVSRPEGFTFEPGQGVDLSIDAEGWRERMRPFTPTSSTKDRIIEFTIKVYPEHAGVTQTLSQLTPGAALTISDAWGTIGYHGPGIFIAGGAGIAPFLAIMRRLQNQGTLAGHGLIFANNSTADVICELELRTAFGKRGCFVIDHEAAAGFETGRVDEALLKRRIDDWNQHFYVCGPPPFNDAVMETLQRLGAKPDALVFEQ